MSYSGQSLAMIKERFFSDPSRTITLSKDEVLMEQGGLNDRLYLVLSGKLKAFSIDEKGKSFEVFRVRKDMFAGVYSFFSGTHISRTKILANEDSTLAYLDSNSLAEGEADAVTHIFLPVVLGDLDARMQTAHQMAEEKEKAIKHLLHTEKMATLGQLAAGLAHELNNAVGVVKSKSETLAERIEELIKKTGTEDLYEFYKKGRTEGQTLSSKEIRKRKNSLIDKLGISQALAKQLARTSYTLKEIIAFRSRLKELELFWDVGASFHDIELASQHASMVVHSVKELGAGSAERVNGLSVSKTLRDAITLIKSVLRQIDLDLKIKEEISINGSSAELVQVWINLLKNACESLLQAKTESPQLKVILEVKTNNAQVRVIDNGPGIPEELIDKIFQPNVTTKKGGLSFGLGLGLPISQRIVENHGGDIKVSSSPGKTEFIVTLPI